MEEISKVSKKVAHLPFARAVGKVRHNPLVPMWDWTGRDARQSEAQSERLFSGRPPRFLRTSQHLDAVGTTAAQRSCSFTQLDGLGLS